MSRKLVVALTALLCLVSLGILWHGQMAWPEVWEGILLRFQGGSDWNPLLDERLPRLLVLICSGASLAVAGAIMQSLFHNPLASPGVLGITTGGSLSVLLVFLSGIYIMFPLAIPLAAIVGCFLTLLLVIALSKSQDPTHISNLILTGIAISTIFIAIQGAVIYCFRDNWSFIQIITEWQAGSTFNRNWQHVHMQLPLTLVGLFGAWCYRHEMNILSLGDEEAKNLGVEVTQVRWRLFLCVALLSGGALAATGTIAFFGLVLPHLVRTLHGPNHRTLIPLCMLAGATMLPCLDLTMRLLNLHYLTIGNISGILGGMFFFALLYQSRNLRRCYA
ncbi:MAG: Hemin transport system permease protein HmuU [Chlamydiae bacterium]|nr:Hemin transport system permease protein HmuU [Chlamydiota bacterium]